jgi:hypothetical protein
MHTPIYSPTEIMAMITAPKCAVIVEWEDSQSRLPKVRDTEGEGCQQIEAYPDDAASKMKFAIIIRESTTTGAFSITLQGRIDSRGWQSLVRYDVHANAHPNEPFCHGPRIIKSGVLHRHVYSDAVFRKFGATKWHACADDKGLSNGGLLKDKQDRLRDGFLTYANLKLVDKTSHLSYWDRN